MTTIGVIGNVARDRVDGKFRVGGGPFHAGRALRALGRRAVIVTKCADADRPQLLTPLICLGLPVLWHESPSTSSFAIEYDGEEREMVVDELGPEWTPDEMAGWVAKSLSGVEWVQVVPLGRHEFPAASLAELGRGRRILLDGQGLVRPASTGRLEPDADFDREVLRELAVLKLSEFEAELLGGLDAGALARFGVPEVLVTLGSRGALVYDGGRLEHVAGRAVEPQSDPTGAGDAFGAVYLAGRAAGNGPVGAARRACSLVADILSGRVR